MRRSPVRSDDKEYAKLLKANMANRFTKVTDEELKQSPRTVEIITGTKPDLGGGPSPDGFVMNGTTMLGRIRIVGRVHNGAIHV